MKLTPREQERLTVFTAAEVIRRHKERGIPLNHPEAVAYITDWCVKRDQDRQLVAEIHSEASQLLDRRNVMGGVPEMTDMIQIESMFPDGIKFVTVHDPVKSGSVSITDSTADAAVDGGDTDGIDTNGGDDA